MSIFSTTKKEKIYKNNEISIYLIILKCFKKKKYIYHPIYMIVDLVILGRTLLYESVDREI
jgi:hypothetical protein